MERNLAIRTLNRLNKIGVLDMQCVKDQFGTDAMRMTGITEWLMNLDINSLKPEIKKIVMMNDEAFDKIVWLGRIYIKRLDRKYLGQGIEYYLF